MEWLASTPYSTALRESLFVYPIVSTLHVLSIGLFVGTIALVDLRLTGAIFAGLPHARVVDRLLPWTKVGFWLAVVTGLLLFYAVPDKTFHSFWFRAKLLLIALGGLNAYAFHRQSPAIRRIGAVSLCVWFLVILTGRMIAYDWVDCGHGGPRWIETLSQCPPEEAAP